jgi:PAS domain S-box-containing protein
MRRRAHQSRRCRGRDRGADRYNAHLAAIVAASNDAIISFDTDFVIQTWNAAAQRLFGFSEAEARGRKLNELVVPNVYRAESVAIFEAVLKGETVLKEILRRHKDGRLVPVEINTSPIVDGSGGVTGTSVIYRDISERRRAEESDTRFRVTFESAPVGIAHVGPDGRWLRVNEALCRILGYPANELTAKTILDVTHPDDLAFSVARFEKVLSGTIDRYEADKRYLRKDGVTVWARLTVNSVRKRDRSMDYLVTVVEDISWRKRAEEELRKSEERFRSSLLCSPLPVLMFDDREQILAASQAFLERTGYSREELCRLEDWTTRAFCERSGEVMKRLRRIIATGPETQPTELIIRTKDGQERLWSFVTSALGPQSDGRRLFVSVGQDMTERKAYEERIHLLMCEARHRSKNMLGLVQAIARQTVAHSPEHFIERFTERIHALAANQDLLVRTQWKGIDVEDLVRTQLAHFADLVGSRITVRGPKLHLNAAAAQTIGLALHELATNATKYGSLSTDAGRVDICWGTRRDTFTVGWIECNGPPVTSRERRGFGTTVIDSMTKRALGGEVELDYAASGLAWRLICPAAHALEPTASSQETERP